MTALIVWASVAAYLTVAAWTARHIVLILSETEPGWRQTHAGWRAENSVLAVIGGLFWPVGLVYTLVRRLVVAPVHAWLWRPVDQRQARLKRLRADLDSWAMKARQASSDDERRMARDVVESLTEIIRGAR